jgi:hypothetical protein
MMALVATIRSEEAAVGLDRRFFRIVWVAGSAVQWLRPRPGSNLSVLSNSFKHFGVGQMIAYAELRGPIRSGTVKVTMMV